MPALDANLLGLEVVQDVSGPFRCEARLSNWGGVAGHLHFDREQLEFGRQLSVKVGDARLFTGRIVALEGRFPAGSPPEIAVSARDRLEELRTTRRSRTFTDLRDADVARQIAADHGLQAVVELDGPVHRALAQLDQTDLDFLRDRVRASGGEAWVDGDRLHVRSRAARRDTAHELTLGANLRECDVRADLAGQPSVVSVQGWDPRKKAVIAATADAAAVAGELDGGQSGAAVLAASFGARPQHLLRTGAASWAEAQAIATAALRAQARRFVTVRGTADGDAALRVGKVVELQGVGPLFGGNYDVIAVTHRFDGQQGWRTEFVAERAGIGQP